MPTIKATCPDCGNIELSRDEVQLHIRVDVNLSSCSFRCTTCGKANSKELSDTVAKLLVDAGVPVRHWSMPPERLAVPDAPPFTHDDLLAFHEDMQTDGVLAEFLAKLNDEADREKRNT